MLLANDKNGGRIRATKEISIGICPDCSGEVIAKCGDVKIWHWSHKSVQNCEYSKRGETDWHLAHKQWWLEHGADIEVKAGNRRIDVVFKGVAIEFQRVTDTLNEIISRTHNHITCGYKVMWVFPKDVSFIGQDGRFMKFLGAQTIIGRVVDNFPNDIVIIIEDLEFNEWFRIVKFYYTSNSKAFVEKFNVDTIFDYFEKGNFQLLCTHGRYEHLMPFGKHKGKSIAEIPSGYLKWLFTIDLYDNTKEAVERELLNRGIEIHKNT